MFLRIGPELYDTRKLNRHVKNVNSYKNVPNAKNFNEFEMLCNKQPH